MTDIQRADLEAAKRGNDFNNITENATALATIVDDDLPNIITEISEQIKVVTDAEWAQQHDGGDLSGNKELLKTAMAKLVIKYALRGQVKAGRLGLETLESALHQSVTFILQADGVLAVTRATDLRNTLNDNIAPAGPLTNVTLVNIKEIDKVINAFETSMNAPTSAIDTKKAQGTDKIQPAVNVLNGLIDQEKTLLHSYWADDETYSGLADEFDLTTHAVVLGIRHNNVDVTLVKDEDGTALAGATVTCLKNKKKVTSVSKNEYIIEGVQVGSQPFLAEAAGRVSVNFDVKVVRKSTVNVVIRMKLV